MLISHMQASEQCLLASARLQTNVGHPLHKGTPRESFINDFLRNHLSETISIGTGEIIDSASRPGEKRNQIDIVLYRGSYPKLTFGGGINGFLVESVIATIEVKSTLTKDELTKAFCAARNIKALKPNVERLLSGGYEPPGVLSFVVAYDGPASMTTVMDWIPQISHECGIDFPLLPLPQAERLKVPSPAIDAICVLGKGVVYFDNAAICIKSIDEEFRREHPNVKWICVDMEHGSLLMLFVTLTKAVCNLSATWINCESYVSNHSLPMRNITGCD